MAGILTSQKSKGLLAAVIFFAAVGIFVYRATRSGPIPSRINYICVATGERFSLDPNRVTTIPALNPNTGEETLLPCAEKDGIWRIGEHYRPAIAALGEKNKHVDPETLVVRNAH